MDFSLLITAAKSVADLRDFVGGSGIQDILSAIGDTELSAARRALSERASSGAAYRSQVWLAVGHLQSAHEAFRASHNRPLAASILRSATRLGSWMITVRKDLWVCCLLALCYAYLGEKESARRALADAKFAAGQMENPPAGILIGMPLWVVLAAFTDTRAAFGQEDRRLRIRPRALEGFFGDLDELLTRRGRRAILGARAHIGASGDQDCSSPG